MKTSCRSFFAAGLIFGGLACAPVVQPKLNGLTPNDADAIAILAVRTSESDPHLQLDVFDTHPTQSGNYTVSLQSKTTSTTANHWRVIIHPDRSAEVVRAETALTEPKTMHANPDALKGDTRLSTPPAPERARIIPSE
ncbi:MAG TPA: hypothetical protein VFE58_09775 [Tepidisphaeraceae bacterium]|jgi:hypothetical protein|nr:hypothetical protein [Tepidisphaeraceae bacterium]